MNNETIINIKPKAIYPRRTHIFDLCENTLQGEDGEYCTPIYYQTLRDAFPDLTFRELAEAIRDASRGDYDVRFSWDSDKSDWIVSY